MLKLLKTREDWCFAAMWVGTVIMTAYLAVRFVYEALQQMGAL